MNIHYKKIAVSYDDVGKGEPIVLLHGFLENKKMWAFFVDSFQSKFRVITIDLLGHGQTSALGYVHTMQENAEMVAMVLTALQIKKCIIIGHSMGGYVALELAKNKSHEVQKLVLLNSTSLPDSAEKKANRDRAIVAVKKDYQTFVRLSIANLFSVENRERLATEIENTKIEALKTPLQGIVASLEGMKIRSDNNDFFRNLEIPKLLILGEKDAVLPCQETAIQTENSDIQLKKLSFGHMSHMENKEELLLIFEFFFDVIKGITK